MASHESSAIKHNDHLLLDQPLLRLPNELLRKNFRSAHFVIERDTSALKNLLKESATAAVSGRASQQDVLKNLDAMITRMRGVKRKLSQYAGEEARLHEHTAARIQHLDDLYGINTVEDVKYESWSRKRLDRLIADYFLRNGFHESAKQLAKERNMERLVDVETFESMGRIRLALLGGSVTEALAWCAENKKELRKMECKLEFMLRLQQYIELIRAGTQPKLVEAITHAKKHLIPYRSQHPREVAQACGLLALPPNSRNSEDCYADLYRPRWTELADLFTTTHNQLLSLPSVPLLHIALSSGLSALKTPACHASTTNQGGGSVRAHHQDDNGSQDHGVCPICSTELNDLAKYVPYAHHTNSHVQPDLVMFPSGKTCSKQRLVDEAKKAGLPSCQVKDPMTGTLHHQEDLKKVYIT
ncbi:unnamed protein product [Clonostachys rosea f. rosea IK726]|uniref:Protein fyv10 n=2 Tax=Bionectria ochroleuca TaxID=29856 RepID=A0A0B7JTH7_BIOOC|nr:unnamed protein product [Clonostachys rosea f. rosea IK726]